MATVEFLDRHLSVRFKENPVVVGAGWYQVECECVDKTIIKRVSHADHSSEDEDGTRHYHVVVTYEEMVAAGLTRYPTVRLRTIKADGYVSSKFEEIDAANPPPIIQTLPSVSGDWNGISVNIVPPQASDLVGYLCAVSPVQVFDPDVESAMDFTANSFYAPLPSGQSTWWVRFAAYDVFGKTELEWTVSQAASAVTADFDEWQALYDQVQEAADEIREGGFAKAIDVRVVSDAVLRTQMDNVRAEKDLIKSTHIDDAPIGSVVVEEQKRTDELVETTNLAFVKSEDGLSLMLRTDKVMVADGVSFASQITLLSSEIDDKTADLRTELTTTVDEFKSEVEDNYVQISTYDTNQATITSKLGTLATENEASAKFEEVMGVMREDGSAIDLNMTKLITGDGRSLAQREAYTEAQFNGTAGVGSKSFLLTTAEAAASDGAAAIDVLEAWGAQVGDAAGSFMSSGKIKLGDGTVLTSKLDTMESSINNRTTTAQVNSLINTQVGPGSSLAQSIQSATTTAGNASSTASLALSAANGNSSQFVLVAGVNGELVGVKGNGTTRQLTLVANEVFIVPSQGGTRQQMIKFAGGAMYIDTIEVRWLGAGTVSASTVIADNLEKTYRGDFNPGVAMANGGQRICLHYAVSRGGPMTINVWVNCQNQGGGSQGVRYYLNVYHAGGSFSLNQFGMYTFDGAGGPTNSTSFPYRITGLPAGGVQFELVGWRVAGGSTMVIDHVYMEATDIGTQTT